MPKINQYLINNKKPVELVQELENEIPSFEEFMKTYENNSNLNYDDLSSGSVGEAKGYGPVIGGCKEEKGYRPPSPIKYDRCRYCKRSMSKNTNDYCYREECLVKKRKEDEKWAKRGENAVCWANRVATGALIAATGPATPFVGAGVLVASEVAKAKCENEWGKKFIGSYGEGGGGVVLEEIGGKLKKFLD